MRCLNILGLFTAGLLTCGLAAAQGAKDAGEPGEAPEAQPKPAVSAEPAAPAAREAEPPPESDPPAAPARDSAGQAQGAPAADSGKAVAAPDGSTEKKKQPPVAKPRIPKPPPTSFPWQVYLAVGGYWNQDDGYHFLARRNAAGRAGIGVTRDVLELPRELRLTLELGYRGESQSEQDVLQGMVEDVDMEAHDWLAGVWLRHHYRPWLSSHARLHGGMSRVQLAFSDPASGDRFRAHDWVPFVGLGVGGAAEASLSRLFALGIFVEAGYVLTPAASFDLEDRDASSDRIGGELADVGSLSRSGPYARAGIGLRF